MSRYTTQISEGLYQYIVDMSVKEHPVLTELRLKTAHHPYAQMQIAPDQGQFLQFMIPLTQAKNVLEIGTFTGYSALCFALALPDEGKVITCDISEEYTAIAKPFWQKANVSHKIELKLGPALDSVHQLEKNGGHSTFDMAFIDADKLNYSHYYEACLSLVKAGGLIIIDNVLWNGSVIDSKNQDKDTQAIRALNEKLRGDSRIDYCLLTVADGLSLVRKK